ncbi:hypothetical protein YASMINEVIRUS_1606 [Yasminevirus sp. GU-2018]|uniref:Uncharacterized protein n=1 Tax=Yasminevirus sp. GU-2018 TaxID=2420051 RepID=A0A5K0UBU6_9VIRU|nr:hypothetical protein YASMINEVIRUS_1606 [Yasminevirus sp. GU-2018]
MDNQSAKTLIYGLFDKYLHRQPTFSEVAIHLNRFKNIHNYQEKSIENEFASCAEAKQYLAKIDALTKINTERDKLLSRPVIIIGHEKTKNYFVDYVDSLIANSDKISAVWLNSRDDYKRLELKNKVIIHIQEMNFPPDSDKDNMHVFFNTESYRNNKSFLNNTKKYPTTLIMDHSVANIVDAVRVDHLIKQRIFHIPYQINPDEISNVRKDKDVIMACITTGRRRDASKPVVDKLNTYLEKRNSHVDFISGWGKYRDDNTFDHKILVSINSYDNMSQISCFRTDRCVFNKMIVIQEIPDNDISNYNNFVHPELQNLMIFAKLSEIYEKTVDVIEHYDQWYEKLFGGVDFDVLRSKLKTKLDDMIDHFISLSKEQT